MSEVKHIEAAMREAEAARPKTIGELSDVVEALVAGEHDYGTCVYAMSLAAVAAFNYVAHRLDVTGFQASCADMDVLRRTRRLEGPFMIIDGSKMLYPQYDLEAQVREALVEWEPWAAKEAQKRLKDLGQHAHPNVKAHMEMLAAKATGSTPA